MKNSKIFNILTAFSTAMLFFSCASTPEAPVQYETTVSPAGGVAVTVEPHYTHRGFTDFQVSISNTQSSDVTIQWAKSTIQYNGKTQHLFLEGQDLATADTGATAETVSAGNSLSQRLYALDQLIISTSMDYSLSGEESDVLAEETSVSFDLLRVQSAIINLVLQRGDKEEIVTAIIEPVAVTAAE
ncbi:MAG: hypothetical protein K6G80_09290 [Treponema sp.]|nr:hypothetical protein [Treponema sp.]